MINLYLFSGLGADERAFSKLDLSGYNVIFIKWISPLKNESLKDYAFRLKPQIETENPILIGLSFGGIMAIEVSKIIASEKIILISSAKSKFEIPLIFRVFGKLRLHKIASFRLLTKVRFVNNWLFGVTSSDDKILLNTILKETDFNFLKWAIDKIVTWDRTDIQNNVFQIHGTKDRILPIGNVKTDVIVQNGGHFMVLNKAKEIREKMEVYLN